MTIIKHELSQKSGKDYYCIAIRKLSESGIEYDVVLTFDNNTILKLTDVMSLASIPVGGYIEI